MATDTQGNVDCAWDLAVNNLPYHYCQPCTCASAWVEGGVTRRSCDGTVTNPSNGYSICRVSEPTCDYDLAMGGYAYAYCYSDLRRLASRPARSTPAAARILARDRSRRGAR